MYIYPHQNQWISEYNTEKKLIIDAFGENIKLYHIGSTAIKDLYAKNCIDILGVVKELAAVQGTASQLIKLGYTYKGSYGIAGRKYFSKKERKVHFHIFEEGDINIKKHLNFIKVMSASPELVDKLNTLKNKLHKQHPNNKERYQKEKMYFYNEIHKML